MESACPGDCRLWEREGKDGFGLVESLRRSTIVPVKELAKILAYLCAVLVGGALLAPPMYWGAHALMEAGWLLLLKKYAFQKYFNRAVLVSALVCLLPLVRWLGVRQWSPPAFRYDPVWVRRGLIGLCVGAGAMGVLVACYLWGGFYRWEGLPSMRVMGSVLVSAAVVGCLEEGLFRGAVQGLIERTQGGRAALWWTSGLFAVVHFLKPDPGVVMGDVRWWSGFELVPHMFHQFARPLLFLGGFGTLLVLGLLLGLAVQRTGSLWMSIGFHAGLVLVKGVFSKGSVRLTESLPWVGPEMQIGLLPVVVLGCAGALVWRLTAPKPRAA